MHRMAEGEGGGENGAGKRRGREERARRSVVGQRKNEFVNVKRETFFERLGVGMQTKVPGEGEEQR